MNKKTLKKAFSLPSFEGLGEACKNMKRVFIAIKVELSPQLAQVSDQLKQKLAVENIRWSPINNLHITLSFIGDVSDEQLERINEMLQQLCSRHSAFSFQLKNIDFFKRRGNPAVIFFDVGQVGQLVELANQLKTSLQVAGIATNANFSPHLTLARINAVKDKDAFYEIMAQIKETSSQKIEVSQVTLFESILKPTGAEYLVINEFRLG